MSILLKSETNNVKFLLIRGKLRAPLFDENGDIIVNCDVYFG